MSGTETKKTIGVAVIGAGGRGRGVTANLLRDSARKVRVVSVFDPDHEQCRRALVEWNSPDCTLCADYPTAIRAPGVDWVLVFSPNAFHCEHVLAAFSAGKDVFSEKPLATTIEDCIRMHDAHLASGRLFATGFVLRYAPLYRKVRSLLDEGVLGRVLSIDANENIDPAHGGYIMANWRRHTSLAGPHVLEKCCHDLDLLNWFSNSLPARVASFGGRDFFVPSNAGMMRKHGEKTFLSWDDPHRVPCPFTGGGDLMDNQVAIIEYRNGVRVQFQATMCNAIPERRMFFSCTEGTLIAELYSSTLTYRRLGDKEETSIPFGADGHGGGDDFIMKALFETMASRTPPACSGEEGLFSAVLALAIDQAAREGRVIDLEPTWVQLGRG